MQFFTSHTDPNLITLINQGGIGVLPTDTVYGLVCSASHETAVTRLYNLKMRQRQPGTTIAASIDQLVAIGFEKETLERAKKLWPNPLSIEMSAKNIQPYLKVNELTMAVRIPRSTALLAMLAQTGPLMTTSANHPGKPGAENIDEARRYFGDNVDFYVDNGVLHGRPPSTIIRFVGNKVEVLRQGACKIDEKGDIK